MFFNNGYKRVLGVVEDMRKQRLNYSFKPSVLIVTWFFIGLFPIAPGTIASVSVYPIFYFIVIGSTSYAEMALSFAVIGLALLFIGLAAVSRFQNRTITHDHKSIVIDEVMGQLIVFAISIESLLDMGGNLSIYCYLQPTTLAFLTGLIAFRFFDIKKPFFIKAIDRRMRNALGVMLDDLCAAIMAGVSVIIISKIYAFAF